MALPDSGSISMTQIRTELGMSGSVSLGDTALRQLSGRLSGSVPMSEFRGKYHMERYVGPIRQSGILLGFGLTVVYRDWMSTRTIGGNRREHTLNIERWVDSRNSWLPDGTSVRITMNTSLSPTQQEILEVPGLLSPRMYWRQTVVNTQIVAPKTSFSIYTNDYEVDWEIL